MHDRTSKNSRLVCVSKKGLVGNGQQPRRIKRLSHYLLRQRSQASILIVRFREGLKGRAGFLRCRMHRGRLHTGRQFTMANRRTALLGRIAAVLLCIVTACSLAGCHSSPSIDSPSNSKSQGAPKTPKQNDSKNEPRSDTPSQPRYEDSRWPTTDPEFLSMPESYRWYNAWDSAETVCTIAGPVVNVYQATGSSGMPIFIDIGTAYPDIDSVTLVVWADQCDSFSQMINDVDNGRAWLSVTGYLSVYDGLLQFDAGEGSISCTWWTNVS